MGQHYYVVNLDKRQFLDPRTFDDGRKLLEFGCSSDGTMNGLALLLAVGNGRGCGDWSGDDPKSLVGSWAGDRIALPGDYVEAGEVGHEAHSAVETYTNISADVRALVEQTHAADRRKTAFFEEVDAHRKAFEYVGVSTSEEAPSAVLPTFTSTSDVFFTRGHGVGHDVCQDYALVVADGVVLSDGCSSAPHTDLGARLLCHAAAHEQTHEATLQRATEALRALGVPRPDCLSATLLRVQHMPLSRCSRRPVLGVRVSGDGVVIGRRRQGLYIAYHVEFTSGAPRYACYDIEPSWRSRYILDFVETPLPGLSAPPYVERTTRWSQVDANPAEWTRAIRDRAEEPQTFAFDVTDFDLVLILSDGVASFRTTEGPVPLRQVVDLLVRTFKNYKGTFVKRTARAFLKQAEKLGWAHDDDFSIAGIRIQSETRT